jgi:Uma2 family endonuclease
MTIAQPEHLTAEAFIAWAAGRPGRYELVAGTVVAMAPERVGHTLVKGNAYAALRAAVARAGLPCQALTDGATVVVDEATAYQPDALLRCGQALDPGALVVPDPLLVVEVASPSSERIDSGAKLEDYARIPGLAHYLILRPETRSVIHHRREADGRFGASFLREGAFALDPPGIELEVADLFDGL